ncbi:MAG: hypothetical protein ABJH98_18035 [Reichenbachiella sp.]|uniref:hypothetical protein n=1 Tax=Reichenbachiella sp. TaxID=2184521 RepID=UPI003298D26E
MNLFRDHKHRKTPGAAIMDLQIENLRNRLMELFDSERAEQLMNNPSEIPGALKDIEIDREFDMFLRSMNPPIIVSQNE